MCRGHLTQSCPRTLTAHSSPLFVYYVQKTRLPAYILIFSLFLLAACNEEKEFLTPKKGEVVLDVRIDNYSLNDKVIGKTAVDFTEIDESSSDQLEQISDTLAKIKPSANQTSMAKLHINENLPYGVFYKSLITLASHYTSIQYVIGENFKEVNHTTIPKTNVDRYSCGISLMSETTFRIKRLRYREEHLDNKILVSEFYRDKEFAIQCLKDYTGLWLTLYDDGNGLVYVVSLNDAEAAKGFRTFTFDSEMDLWKFIETLRSKVEFQNKKDRDEIIFMLRQDFPLKKLVPIIKKLKDYGYYINHAVFRW